MLKLLQIPYFNAQIFLENKTAIGKVDEIFGIINAPVRLALLLEGCKMMKHFQSE